MSPVFRRQEFVELRRLVRVVYPWRNDSVAKRSAINVSIGELQPAIEKIMDDRTMGGTLSETRMKSILNESRMQFIEDLAGSEDATSNSKSLGSNKSVNWSRKCCQQTQTLGTPWEM